MAEQGHSGLGLEAQRASVRAVVAAQAWKLVAEHEDIASGKDDRRPGFQAALARCRQLGAVLVAARLDRITRRAHTLSQLLEEGVAIRAADMPGADELMLRIYAAMAQKECELINGRTRAALAAAKARGTVLGGDRGWRPSQGPEAGRASLARQETLQRAAHRLALEVERLRNRTGALSGWRQGPRQVQLVGTAVVLGRGRRDPRLLLAGRIIPTVDTAVVFFLGNSPILRDAERPWR
jgi:DNA invertase Pin-like site-specific DNA recombinase